jgi:hypothetical protein
MELFLLKFMFIKQFNEIINIFTNFRVKDNKILLKYYGNIKKYYLSFEYFTLIVEIMDIFSSLSPSFSTPPAIVPLKITLKKDFDAIIDIILK